MEVSSVCRPASTPVRYVGRCQCRTINWQRTESAPGRAQQYFTPRHHCVVAMNEVSFCFRYMNDSVLAMPNRRSCSLGSTDLNSHTILVSKHERLNSANVVRCTGRTNSTRSRYHAAEGYLVPVVQYAFLFQVNPPSFVPPFSPSSRSLHHLGPSDRYGDELLQLPI